MRRNNDKKPQPPRHGQIKCATMKMAHAKSHLATMVASTAEVSRYGGHEAVCSSEGEFAPGGAARADYETTSANDNPDPDFSGTSR